MYRTKEIRFNFNQLRGAIRASGLTQAQFAEKIGMSSATLSMKLNNHGDFTSSETYAICKFLNISDPNPYFFTLEV